MSAIFLALWSIIVSNFITRYLSMLLQHSRQYPQLMESGEEQGALLDLAFPSCCEAAAKLSGCKSEVRRGAEGQDTSQRVAQQSSVPVQQKALCCLLKEATNYQSKMLVYTGTFMSLRNGLRSPVSSQRPSQVFLDYLIKYTCVPVKMQTHE